MKTIKKISIIFFSLVVYMYVCNITLLPSNIIVFKGEDVALKTVFGLSVRKTSNEKIKSVQASNELKTESSAYASSGSYELNLDLFGTIPVKEINVNVIERTKVIPCGDLIGVKLYAQGALVVGFSEIEGIDGKQYRPYAESGIREGDTITEINNQQVTNTEDVITMINSSKGETIEIKYIRDNNTNICKIQPIKSGMDEYKIGIWVRDATAGVGTLTFVEPSTGSFAALGHGIVDIDTGGIFNIANGQLVGSNLLSIKKGVKNNPGEIKGVVNSTKMIGEISKNTNYGVFGTVSDESYLNDKANKEYEVALRNEIKEGEAELICKLGESENTTYKIKIEKIYTSNNYDNKSMLIKITDNRLLSKTGGIIQGMSGSPIIQNGKFIGAITNVLVSDPTTGYAIFGDLMVKQMKSSS